MFVCLHALGGGGGGLEYKTDREVPMTVLFLPRSVLQGALVEKHTRSQKFAKKYNRISAKSAIGSGIF